MYALQTVGDSSVSLRPEQKACRECVFDSKDAFVWLPTGSGKFICLPFTVFDKKLGRDNRLVVVVHRYLQQFSPTYRAHVCTSDTRVEADCRLTAVTALER